MHAFRSSLQNSTHVKPFVTFDTQKCLVYVSSLTPLIYTLSLTESNAERLAWSSCPNFSISCPSGLLLSFFTEF